MLPRQAGSVIASSIQILCYCRSVCVIILKMCVCHSVSVSALVKRLREETNDALIQRRFDLIQALRNVCVL